MRPSTRPANYCATHPPWIGRRAAYGRPLSFLFLFLLCLSSLPPLSTAATSLSRYTTFHPKIALRSRLQREYIRFDSKDVVECETKSTWAKYFERKNITSYRPLIELSTLANCVPPAQGEILAFVTLCKKVVGCDVYQRWSSTHRQCKFSQGHKVFFMTANKTALPVGIRLREADIRAASSSCRSSCSTSLFARPSFCDRNGEHRDANTTTDVRQDYQSARTKAKTLLGAGTGDAEEVGAHLRPPYFRYESVEQRQLSSHAFYKRNCDA
ncbi:hypothetical protein ALC62_02655 [Cyphomyrmex costatus]|uniref:Uncharacterized protein n=1 Tax=Cyphomyrmex costatus TaxID=456900 RepID=A0A195D072_9HYME|nr:hypothetical protein ALC62_02655 [Cyphomyrmex costatus]